jgi:hypothetical protein
MSFNEAVQDIFSNTIGHKSKSFVYDYDKDEWFGGDPFKLFSNGLAIHGYELEEAQEDGDNAYYTIDGVRYVSSREVINVFELDTNGHHGGWEYIFRDLEEVEL